MAGDYIFHEDTEAVSPRRMDKLLKLFIAAAFLVLLGALIWLIGIAPFMPFSQIEITGYSGLAQEEIFAAAGITTSSSYISTNVKSVERALMSIPAVQSARVFRQFPGKLLIVLTGRRPVGFTLASLNGRSIPVFFDSQGVVFRIGADRNAEPLPPAVPAVSGLVIEDLFLGMRLPAVFLSLFRQLEQIAASAPELLGAVSEVRINQKPFDGFDLIVFPAHGKIKVRLNELNEDALRYTLLIVDVLASEDPGIEMLDFRSSIASYIPKEASSE